MSEMTIELRGPCPKDIIDVLDAYSMARGLNRTQLVNDILGKWADGVLHETSVMLSVARGNPVLAEKIGI